MKHIWLVVLLAGCSMLKARTYDAVEYDYVITTVVNSTQAIHLCAKQDKDYASFVQALSANSLHLEEYITNKADTKQIEPAVKQIIAMSKDLSLRSSYSEMYCKHKLSNIQESSRTLARALGNTDKFDLCKGDVQMRYSLFELSYKTDKITLSEFKELTKDILKLKEVNQSSCTLENRIKMEETINLIEKSASILGAL